MKKAVNSATNWLTQKVQANPKLNPIPCAFFRSIISKQVEWASKRGVTLDFSELADAVRTELLKSGIYTQADGQNQTPASHTNSEARGEIPPLMVKFNSAGDAMCAITIFDWLQNVFQKAHATRSSGVELSARI